MKKNIVIFISIILMFLFSSSMTMAQGIEDNSIEKKLNETDVKEVDFDFSLQTFSSCQNMEDVMESYVKDYWSTHYKNNQRYYPEDDVLFGLDNVMMSNDMSESSVSPAGAQKSKSDFSQTNTQVKGVDESDIIKTDGEYIYYYVQKDKSVYIVNAKDSKNLEIVKKINVPKNIYSPVMYIDEGRLVLLANGYSRSQYKNKYWYSRGTKTYTIIFDTTDIKNPKLLKLYVNEGSVKKSRKIGDNLYVISNNNFNIPYYSFKSDDDIEIDGESLIPRSVEISKNSNTQEQNLKLKNKSLPYTVSSGKVAECNEIQYSLPSKDTLGQFDFSPSYNIISTINIRNTEEKVKTDIVAGNNAEIYMSLDNLYMTEQMYQTYDFSCPRGMFCMMPFFERGTSTLVHKLNITNDSVDYQDTTIIPGKPLNQYSMDEYKGDFRIITQKYVPERSSALYILDENLKLKSSLTGLGKTEDFKSSRFMGDKLFLVTFQQIDPLYVIDVADSSNPKILGELKMPGYSTYLHPYDQNHIIGIGYDTTTNKWGGTVNNGVKIDLYEVDYNRKPLDYKESSEYKDCVKKVVESLPKDTAHLMDPDYSKCESLDIVGQKNLGDIYVAQKFTKTIGNYGSSSEALRNPRMFMWNADRKLLLMPITSYLTEPGDIYKKIDFEQGLYAFSIDKDTGIDEKYLVSHIDYGDLESQRNKECEKYSTKNNEEVCRELFDGTMYCKPKKQLYVPDYCYADSNISEYKVRKSYNFRDLYVKRALWIGDNTYSISDSKIISSDITTGKQIDTLNFK